MPRPILFNSPLGAEVLRFQGLSAQQGVSQLGALQVDLVADKPDLSAEDLLGQHAGVSLLMRDGSERHFNGLVTRFAIGPAQGRHYGYQATLRPWLWILTRTSDCRIFQNKDVKQIVEQVFGDHAGIANFQFKLTRSYRSRTYCVQYRESDYNFVARLLEEEGIYWYFEHSAGLHTLVLTDALAQLNPAPGCPPLTYFPNEGQVPPNVDYVSHWDAGSELHSGKVVTTSYDFERPSASLLANQSLPRGHAEDSLELFDFEGIYTQLGDGQQLQDNRIDEQQSRFRRAQGHTNAIGLASGYLFELQQHPHAQQDGKYLCLSIHSEVRVASYEAGAAAGAAGGTELDYRCRFEAMPATLTFRPSRRTAKPFVQGPQTAVVVGPAGDEIHTDKYGRVKVQFHWDRYGKNDDKSSCWVRVASPWAGNSFGFVQIPRIGQEVVVNFLEGDPDQPIITGRVYNAANMPPWELPANATQSGVLSRSSKGGVYSNANALRFEDKKGEEQLWLHAEKDQLTEVEHDEDKWVGNDRRKTIDRHETTLVKGNRTETVNLDETITVHKNRTETVDLNETITIGVNRTESVGANESITIGANRTISVGASETATVALQRTHTVGINETIAIGAAQEIAIGAAQVVAVGAMQTVTVGANRSISAGANLSTSVGANESRTVGSNRSASIGKDDSLKVGKNLVIDAGDSVTIKTGSASITMKKDGTIVIKGKDITLDGSGKINVKASSDVIIKGSKVLQN